MGMRKHLYFRDNWLQDKGFGDASWGYLHIPFLEWAVRKHRPFFEFSY